MSSQAYIIEIGSDAVGIVVREAGESAFQFHSALSAFRALDGKKFATAQAAQKAALDHDAKLPRLAGRAAQPELEFV
ncbi:MAG: hypothetical protein K8F92_03790 [Hyphomicrobium sp.]|uniref:hypothetical protein n=1 Tax=Hyphomicrobium sp. TaxID=82 RepID=UPI00132A38B0|nr:hypothetical protein [Hyphomicrobium sp.]KAB2939491.1 MAG: hypothetical protein F9K20_16545 [Hyphomicrobium sp.]MBZ0208763.1 hypothetical protein [Hyphomicrobium sp.]